MDEHAARKNRHINMRCLHRVAWSRHRSGLDGFEAIKAIFVGSRTAPAREARIERLLLLIVRVIITAVSIRLPDFHHGVRYWFSIPVEDAALDADPLSLCRIGGEDVHRPACKPDGVERADGLRWGLL